MEIRCFCPHCGQEFSITVQEQEKAKTEPKKRNVSEEVRAAAAERMRAMRAQGIGGRPKGVKEAGHRSTWGKARKATEGA